MILLVIANASWVGLCGLAAVQFAAAASGLGLTPFLGDGLFAAAEWRVLRVCSPCSVSSALVAPAH